jgi:adenine-specific DNA-methyltransferase
MIISPKYSRRVGVTLYEGDCRDFLRTLPRNSATLIVTSPPYNIGKPYEAGRLSIDRYVDGQTEVINECAKILHPRGSICWQVGNHVSGHEVVPLDILLYPKFKARGLRLRNRIAWTFEHGLHCKRRFSGRHETILWLTKSEDYVFDLDAVRVPQKYPGKRHFRGPNRGAYSSNPLGKNPGDVWSIPNVKANHPEKTAHPCQFPIELAGRLILALTRPGSLVVDPFAGVGSTGAAAVITGRRFAGAEIIPQYCGIARQRIAAAVDGSLRFRPFAKPIYVPPGDSPLLTRTGVEHPALDHSGVKPTTLAAGNI